MSAQLCDPFKGVNGHIAFGVGLVRISIAF